MTDPVEITDNSTEISEDAVPEEVIDPVLAAQIMQEGAVEDRRFLHFFYKIFLVCGLLGSLGCLVIGKAQAGSFLLAFYAWPPFCFSGIWPSIASSNPAKPVVSGKLYWFLSDISCLAASFMALFRCLSCAGPGLLLGH